MKERPFLRAIKLAAQLHELPSLESPEADAVRDELDGPWMLLTPVQKSVFSGVLGQLMREKKA